MDNDFFIGKNILIMGMGRFGGGVDAAKFAATRCSRVIVTDLACRDELGESLKQLSDYTNIEYHLGCHSEDDFIQTDIVIANPAVPPDNKFLKIAIDNNKIITSQIAIFFEFCPAKIIGITGSNGKSTTTALTTHLLRNTQNPNYNKVWLSGNIGNEPLLMLLDKIKINDLVVLELSSFQIEQLAKERKAPHIALLTNLLPNHLDRYGTFSKYCASKEPLFANQIPDGESLPVSIFNNEDQIASQWYEKYKKQANRICSTYSSNDIGQFIARRFQLPGKCNLSNLAAAMKIAKLFDISDEQVAESAPEFKALPHRLEFIAEHNGIKWFNDSKATTPEASIAALQAFEEPIILIAGGYDKNLPFQTLAKVIIDKCKAVILLGQTADKIKKDVESFASKKNSPVVEICDTLKQAVNAANQKASPSDVILLSPACTSYDMFDNYQTRGKQFKTLVFDIAR